MKNKMKFGVASFLSLVFLNGCAPANISSNLREPSGSGTSMQTRCVNITTGNKNVMNDVLEEFDGWTVVYTSEYTTANKATSALVMCFERPYSK